MTTTTEPTARQIAYLTDLVGQYRTLGGNPEACDDMLAIATTRKAASVSIQTALELLTGRRNRLAREAAVTARREAYRARAIAAAARRGHTIDFSEANADMIDEDLLAWNDAADADEMEAA